MNTTQEQTARDLAEAIDNGWVLTNREIDEAVRKAIEEDNERRKMVKRPTR